MVTAGIYLMARLNFVLIQAPLALAIIVVVALLTAFVAAAIALTQSDIKKVLAYSTVSQLGFMFLAVGAGAFWIALFHVITHAFFKACLFLSAGSVIHSCHHEQDMRKMGGLLKTMPITAFSYGISLFAIAGVWPFSGYFSKHGIIESLSQLNNEYLGSFVTWVPMIATVIAFMTAFYMMRSFSLTFLGSYRGTAHPHEAPALMTIPVAMLAIGALLAGLILHHALPQYLSAVLPNESSEEGGSPLSILIASLPGILGLVAGWFVYRQGTSSDQALERALGPVATFSKRAFLFDELYGRIFVGPLRSVSRALWRTVDVKLIDGSVYGIGYVSQATGELMRRLETGQVAHYAFIMFVMILALFALYVVP